MIKNFIRFIVDARDNYRCKNWEKAAEIYIKLYSQYKYPFLNIMAERCKKIYNGNEDLLDEFGAFIMLGK